MFLENELDRSTIIIYKIENGLESIKSSILLIKIYVFSAKEIFK